MATIKVFSAGGIKTLQCFDTLDDVDFDTPEEIFADEDPTEFIDNLESE